MVGDELKDRLSVDVDYSPNAQEQHVEDGNERQGRKCSLMSANFVAYGMIFLNRMPSSPSPIDSPHSPTPKENQYIYWTFDLGRSVTNKPSCFTNHLDTASAFGDLMAKMQDNVHTNKSLLIQLWDR